MSETKSDFMVINRRTLEEKEYWVKKLATPTETAGLRTDYPRPAGFSEQTGAIELNLDGELHRQLIKLTKGGHFLLYTTLMTALKVCLHKYTEGDRVVVGSPARLPEGDSSQPVNALAIVDYVSDELPFRELLMSVRQTLLDAYSKQLYPYQRLVKDLNLDGLSNKCPLFDIALVLKNIHGELPHVKNDITFIFDKETEQTTGTVIFNTSLFKLKTIERFANHFKTALRNALENTDTRVGELTLYTPAERQRLLHEWNETRSDYSYEECIHHLFEQQAAHDPQALAVASQDSSITYGELNVRANRLAHALRERGVGAETLVGICLPRSIDSIVAMLATLKAGGAYVPLEPDYPRQRLSYMLEDACAALVITRSELLERLPGTGQDILCLDTEGEHLGMHNGENPAGPARAQNLAYAIYTSGSTGAPKAVAVTHAGLTNLVKWHIGEYEVTPEDRATLMAAQGFDAAVWELWPYLVAGASVHIVGEEARNSGARLMQWMLKEQVTLSFVATPLAEVLITEQWPQEKKLRAILTGGDRLHRRPGGEQGLRLVNHYGPTENTVVATFGEVAEEGRGEGLPTIGRAMKNVRVYILDGKQRVVGEGVPGELYIGGAGLARGYWQRADLTAERFVPDELSGEAGGRLYRTGDLVRYVEDGQLEFLGRVDEQVKIRGYRVEPEEVEAILLEHEQVSEAAVVARASGEGAGRRLVAYVVLKAGKEIGSDDLKQYLSERLPEHMLPSALVLLPFLPLSPNGKVDRRALPTPNDARQGAARGYVAPRNGVEKLLVEIWSQVLGVEEIGIDDNFFELGGDSILSIQIIARANQKNIHFTAKQLFLHKTIAELAKEVGDVRTVEAEQGRVTGSVPLTPIQHWFFEQKVADVHHWNHAMLLELRQPPQPDHLNKAVEELLLHHDALRLRFDLSETESRQRIVESAESGSFVHVDLSALAFAEQQRRMEETTAALQASLNLSVGPLLRVAYFDEGGGRPGKLLFIIHHLVVDGVSWRILLEDFNTSYSRALDNKPAALCQKTTSFKYWAERLSGEAQTARIKSELNFWLNQDELEDRPLPLDFTDGENLAGSAQAVNVFLSPEETKALLQDVPTTYGSEINDVLLAALVEAMSRWSGRRALRVTLEGHGREEIFDEVDLSRTIGWFTTMFPVHLDLSMARSKEESIKAVMGQLKEIPNRGIGYGMLKYLCRDEEVKERMRRIPQPQISFNYFGQLDQIFEPESLFDPGETTDSDSVNEKGASGQSARGKRFHILDVTAHVVGGRLELGLIYSENLHRRVTIEMLAHDFAEHLRGMISGSQDISMSGYAPAVFSRANLSEEELQILLAQVEGPALGQ